MSHRAHSRRALLLVAAVAAAPAALPALARADSVADRVAAEIRKCANRERAKRGLPHLADNLILDKAARFHAKNMAKNDFFDHTDPQGRGPAERIDIFGSWEAFEGIGENISAGEDGPAQACRDWMNSEGHRHNILDPAFHAVGGGFAEGDTSDRFYYVQEFGEKNIGPPPPKKKDVAKGPPTGPKIAVRLFNAQDSLTVSVDDQRRGTVHAGESKTVELGQLAPQSRIVVEAFSSTGYLSWGLEQRRGKRTVYRDSGAEGTRAAPTQTTVDLATGPQPMVHRVTLDPRGRLVGTASVRPSRFPPPAGPSPLARWR